MLTTLNGMFSKPKPHRLNFIKENKKKLKEISTMVNQNSSKSRFDVTKSRSSQTEVKRSSSRSSTGFREKNSTASVSRLSAKGSMAIFLQEKKDKGSISSVSLSPNQASSHKGMMLKNQSCQTIDPRRCDQLYHEGVIKYPSHKILQELAEIEKQKANRLDAHVKKEFFKRNKVKRRSPNRLNLAKTSMKSSGKGDEADEALTTESEEEVVEEDKEKEKEPEPQEVLPTPSKSVKLNPVQTTMRAAEIIRRTTEDLQHTPRVHNAFDHTPSNKGDSKPAKKLKKKSSKEEEILKTVLDPQCPPGHIPLPDAERKKTLHMLRVSHAELVREMNLLPVRTDTLRIRQKKIQLENQLNKIEEGIKVFNKSKVYVKIEE